LLTENSVPIENKFSENSFEKLLEVLNFLDHQILKKQEEISHSDTIYRKLLCSPRKFL